VADALGDKSYKDLYIKNEGQREFGNHFKGFRLYNRLYVLNNGLYIS